MLRPLFTIVVLSASLGLAAPSRADHAGSATTRDVQELQFELDNLDESLANLSTSDPRYQDLQQRVEWLRRDVGRLESQIRAHQRDADQGLGATSDEVQKLRDDARSLQRDLARSGERWDRTATVPEGTELQIQLDDALSSQTARAEDRVQASVAHPVVVGGQVVIPAGARVEGVVRRAEPASLPARAGQLDLTVDRLVLDDGRSVPLQSRIVSVGRQDERFNRRNAGIGAVLGGVLGSVVGGTKGAIVGVIVGGAGGGLAAANVGRNVELPMGAPLTLRLERPLAATAWNDRNGN
jgi:outer membrane lipoprotein SlyB